MSLSYQKKKKSIQIITQLGTYFVYILIKVIAFSNYIDE